MRIIGLPEEPDVEGAIIPVTLADIVFDGDADELRSVGEFLLRMAAEVEVAISNNSAVYVGIDLGNSRPNAQVGLSVNVARYCDE